MEIELDRRAQKSLKLDLRYIGDAGIVLKVALFILEQTLQYHRTA